MSSKQALVVLLNLDLIPPEVITISIGKEQVALLRAINSTQVWLVQPDTQSEMELR